MDRPLTPSQRRGRLARRALPAALATLAVAAALVALPRALTPSLEASSIRVAAVERGDVASVVEAQGVVEPEAERLVASPIEARLLRVLRRPGDVVAAGDPLVELDVAAARAELGRLEDRVAGLRLEAQQAELSRSRALEDLDARLGSRRLESGVARARLARAEKLHAEGLVSEEVLDERRLEAARADIDVRGLEQAASSERRAGASSAGASRLLLQQAERERDEQQRQLGLAAARAEESGIVTWILDEPGRAVGRGDALARVASMGSHRVRATVSDTQAAKVRPGLPVRVRTAAFEIPAHVGSVDPAVENGLLAFDVVLETQHEALRPSLRVDAWVVTGSRPGVLRLPRGAATQGRAAGRVFVVRDGLATPREVSFGLAGPDAVEIVAGLEEGEQVIVSDMSDHESARRIRIR